MLESPVWGRNKCWIKLRVSQSAIWAFLCCCYKRGGSSTCAKVVLQSGLWQGESVLLCISVGSSTCTSQKVVMEPQKFRSKAITITWLPELHSKYSHPTFCCIFIVPSPWVCICSLWWAAEQLLAAQGKSSVGVAGLIFMNSLALQMPFLLPGAPQILTGDFFPVCRGASLKSPPAHPATAPQCPEVGTARALSFVPGRISPWRSWNDQIDSLEKAKIWNASATSFGQFGQFSGQPCVRHERLKSPRQNKANRKNPLKKNRLVQPDIKCGSPGRCWRQDCSPSPVSALPQHQNVKVAKSFNGSKAQIMHHWCPL